MTASGTVAAMQVTELHAEITRLVRAGTPSPAAIGELIAWLGPHVLTEVFQYLTWALPVAVLGTAAAIILAAAA